ncbi:hypothetical protein D7252_01525 [Microbacterium sp. CGR2]|nr:hypothetical protein D7252_01525 [Microbacterium sp. CGR2]
MTDETARALRDAIAAESAAEAHADELKRECLEKIAGELPARAEAIARRLAQEQPDVTKSLGRDGVAQLRVDVSHAATELGEQFVAAIDEIEWPAKTSTFDKISPRHIHAALFGRFFRETGSLAAAIASHGYSFGEKDIKVAILPQELYEEKSFTSVAGALEDLARARAATASARKEDDEATVSDLWGN